MDKRNTGYLGRKIICSPDYCTSHTFGNGFWSNPLKRLIRNGFWCCFSTDEQIYLATLKPSVSQIGGSSMGVGCFDRCLQLLLESNWLYIWLPTTISHNVAQSLCLPASHPLTLHPLFILGLTLQLWHWLHHLGRVSLPAKKCFAEMWLLSKRLFLSHLVLLFRPFDLIPASVVLFVLLLIPRILLLF